MKYAYFYIVIVVFLAAQTTHATDFSITNENTTIKHLSSGDRNSNLEYRMIEKSIPDVVL